MNTSKQTEADTRQQSLPTRTVLWRWLRRIPWTSMALTVIGLATVYIALPPRGIFLSDSWQFKEKHDGPVIGDLGGVPVLIPTEFADFIECHDVPHPAAACNLWASLSPSAHADIRIHLRRGLLPQWADILKNAKAKVQAFKHMP